MMDSYDKIYVLAFAIRACRAVILVNGVPLARCISGGSVQQQLRVEHVLFSGANSISIEVASREIKNKDARISAKLLCKHGPPGQSRTDLLLGALLESGDIAGAYGSGFSLHRSPIIERVMLGETVTTFETTESIDCLWGQRVWHSSPRVVDSASVRNGLVSESKRLLGALRSRDPALLLDLLLIKRKLYAESFSISLEDVDESMGFLHAAVARELTPRDPDWDNYTVDVRGGGRIARLINADGDGPVVVAGGGAATFFTCWYAYFDGVLKQVL